MAFSIGRDEEVYAALQRIVGEQIDAGLRELDLAAEGGPEAVHGFRKRCKKLRGLLRLIRPSMTGAGFEAADQTLRSAARALSEIRDAQVRAQTVEAIGAAQDDPGTGAGPHDFHAAAWAPRVALHEARAQFTSWQPPAELEPAIVEGFRKTYGRCRKRWERARRKPTDANFHHLRRWVKYHWYQVRLLEKLGPRSLHKRRDALRISGDILGKLQDLAVLSQTSPKRMRDRIESKKRRLRKRVEPMLERLMRPAASVLTTQLERSLAGRAAT